MALSLPSFGLGFGGGLVVALLGAFLTMSPSSPRESTPAPADDPVDDDGDDDDDDDTERSGGPSRANPLSGTPASTPAQMRAEIAQLKSELDIERKKRAQAEGTPLAFPAETAARHTQEGLMTAVRAALAELKLNGDVSAVDCTENPCLASVHVHGPLDLEKLLKAPALAPYAKDRPSYSATSFAEGEGDNVVVLGWSESTEIRIDPNDPEHDEKLEAFKAQRTEDSARRNARVRAFFQAGVDERPPAPAPAP